MPIVNATQLLPTSNSPPPRDPRAPSNGTNATGPDAGWVTPRRALKPKTAANPPENATSTSNRFSPLASPAPRSKKKPNVTQVPAPEAPVSWVFCEDSCYTLKRGDATCRVSGDSIETPIANELEKRCGARRVLYYPDTPLTNRGRTTTSSIECTGSEEGQKCAEEAFAVYRNRQIVAGVGVLPLIAGTVLKAFTCGFALDALQGSKRCPGYIASALLGAVVGGASSAAETALGAAILAAARPEVGYDVAAGAMQGAAGGALIGCVMGILTRLCHFADLPGDGRKAIYGSVGGSSAVLSSFLGAVAGMFAGVPFGLAGGRPTMHPEASFGAQAVGHILWVPVAAAALPLLARFDKPRF